MPPSPPRASNKSYTIIDKATGKKVDGYGLIVPKSRGPHPYGNEGAQISLETLKHLAINKELSKRALRIAVWMISQVPRSGPMTIRRTDIAAALRMGRGDVSKGLAELHAHGARHDQSGEFHPPILPPGPKPLVGVRASFVWRGTSDALAEAILKEQEEDAVYRDAEKLHNDLKRTVSEGS